MKKLITTVFAVLGMFAVNAQQKNEFDNNVFPQITLIFSLIAQIMLKSSAKSAYI